MSSRSCSMLIPACALLLTLAARAETPQTRARFDLEPQPMARALNAFAQQAGLNIYFDPPAVAGLNAPSLKAEMTANDALTRLLAGTRLQAIYVDRNTVRVVPATRDAPAKNPAAAEDSVVPTNLVRVAQAAAVEDEQKSAEPKAADETAARGVPEILVRGSRSSNTDIQRTADDVQPYVVFKAEEIERSMAGNLEEFLLNRLPMNAAAGSNARQAAVSGNGNQSQVNLRGLGSNQTLILVNGRRLPGVFNGRDLTQPDINGIALSTVERIEVLPSTAGGIYGGGATGGVINIILKSDYTGVELRARYENTFETDAAQLRVEGNAAFQLEDGRSSILLSASHSASNELLASDRDLLRRGRMRYFDNTGTLGSPPVGATANLRSADGSLLVLKSTGQSLGYSFAHAPVGYAGYQADGGLPFLATAGRYNLDPPGGLAGEGSALLLAPGQSSVTANLRRDFTSRIDAFIDAALYENKGKVAYSNFHRSNITLPRTAPNNPFDQAIVVRFGGADFTWGAQVRTLSQTLATTTGLRLRLPHDWSAQFEYGWSRSRFERSSGSSVITADGIRALADGRLDILRDVESHPLDYTPYLFTPVPSDYMLEPNQSVLRSMTGRFAGPLLTLPGGTLMLSALLERDEHQGRQGLGVSHSVPDTPIYRYVPPRGQVVESGYVELTAPLVSARNALRLVRALDLQASYRHDRTTTQALASANQSSLVVASPDGPFPDVPYVRNIVTAGQYTLGLRYQPVESLALRASFGAGILPPSLSQLAPARISTPLSFLGVVDPKRGLTIPPASTQWVDLGDPDLRPERSRSWSAGVIHTPASLPGLRLSVDYTRIRKTDEITALDPQALIDLEDFFPGRVVRAELTDADRQAGYTGGVMQVFKSGPLNVAHTALEAYDVQGDYRWRTAYGVFSARLIATYATYYRRQVLENSARLDAVSLLDGPLEWRGNAGVTWERDAWTAGWNMQYFAPYQVYLSTTSSTTVAAVRQRQGDGGWIPSQHYHDVFLKYRIDARAGRARALRDSELMLGVSNLFDTLPPVIATNSWSGGGYSTYGDPRLRRYTLSFRRNF